MQLHKNSLCCHAGVARPRLSMTQDNAWLHQPCRRLVGTGDVSSGTLSELAIAIQALHVDFQEMCL